MNDRTGVIIMLKGGNHLFGATNTYENAKGWVDRWIGWMNGATQEWKVMVGDSGTGGPAWAVSIVDIIGIYAIEADNQPTAQDKAAEAAQRMAKAMEKGLNQGDEWKGDE